MDDVTSPQVLTGKTLTNDHLNVYDGGIVSRTTLNKDSYLQVYGGGSAVSTTVNSGGDLYVYDGGTAVSTTVNSSAYLDVFGGVANNVTVNSKGRTFVYDGGEANNVTVSSEGKLRVYSGGMVTSAILKAFGTVEVSSGGTALGLDWTPCVGILYVNEGATVTYAKNLTGVYFGANQAKPTSATTMNNKAVGANQVMCVMEGGIANAATVNKGGGVFVYSGGTALNLKENGGFVEVAEGASATFVPNTLKSLVLSDTGATLHSGTTANSVTTSDGDLYVFDGGVASKVTMNDGEVEVYSGGVVNNTTVNSSSDLYLLGGVANVVTINYDGDMEIYDGGEANNVTVNSRGWMAVNDGAANSVTVKKGGEVLVGYSGVVGSATVSAGGFFDLQGEWGVALNVTVLSGGSMNAQGGAAVNTTVRAGGSLTIRNSPILTGTLTIEAGAYVYAEGGIIEFDVAAVAPGGPALVNDLSLIQGYPDFRITVSEAQAAGDYVLAGGAAGFDEYVGILIGENYSEISVGNSVELSGRTYTLNLDNATAALSLTVEGDVPPPTPTGFTSGDLNGDGRADIVMTIAQDGHSADGSTGAWLIQSDQTAAWGDLSQRNPGWEIFGTGVTLAGKKTCDVYVKSSENVVGAWVLDDAGAVAAWETIGEFDATTNVLGLGDFNGDGQTDLLLRNDNGAVGCFLTDGTGWNYFQSLGDEWTIAAVGDLNGDGRDDVVLKHDAGFAGSWLTQSDCTMAWANLDTLADGFTIVGCGDFDGDGTSDVLLQNGGYYGAWIVEDGSVSTWMGLGDLGSVTVEQIADFDGDGIDDLRIRTAGGDIGAQLVKGADTLEWKYYGSVGDEWSTGLAAI